MDIIRFPVGEENFELLRRKQSYYIDKTRFIADLMREDFKVNLITRPRRFGKTLTMSMLEAFFDIRRDSREIFEGLEIIHCEKLCREWMNQWPVLFLSFKDLSRTEFETSYKQLLINISSLCIEHSYLLQSNLVDEEDKECFIRLKSKKADELEVENSLFILSRMLYSHFGKPVILLIDEYDVPLAKAEEYGYYDKMLDVIRSIMSTAFKTNKFLQFAVVTGCLHIAKESIFTGVNNFKVNSIVGSRYMDSFGFSVDEVTQMLQETNLISHLDAMMHWYDGYHFGQYNVCCPWDVLNYVADLQSQPDRKPSNYWKDTSHNDIIKKFVGRDGIDVNDKLEILLSGGSIRTQIKENLTYHFNNASETDFWSILYLTGYLTIEREKAKYLEDEVSLKIPNEEVRTIFGDTIVEWFKETIGIKAAERSEMFHAWWSGEEKKVTEAVSIILNDTISYYDYREDFYHAFIAGLFSGAGYLVSSNDENGIGRADVIVKDRKTRKVIIIEVKQSGSEAGMEQDSREALQQIDLKQYASKYLNGYKTIQCYGASFYRKKCFIKRITIAGQGEGSVFEME